MLTLTSLRFFSSAIFSSTGATAWQGPHHSAQKSTITGFSLLSTSCSKGWLVNFSPNFLSRRLSSLETLDAGPFFPPERPYNRIVEPPFQPLPSVPDHVG